jgi:protein-tyrosine phosphatase
MKEYFNEDDGIIQLGDTVWIRDEGTGVYKDKFLIIEEYTNIYKVQDLEHPSALQFYVTKDTFDLVNGDGGVKTNKDTGGNMRWFKRRKKGNAPLKTKTVASEEPLTQPVGSKTGPAKTKTYQGKYGGTYTPSYGGGFGYGSTWNSKMNCHKGNTVIASRRLDNTSNFLMIGGWSRDAYTSSNMTVINLTGFAKKFSDRSSHWYDFKITDYDIPDWHEFFWRQLADLVYFHLKQGDVLIACQGGHGRSGTVATVVAGLLQDKTDFTLVDGEEYFDNPLKWIRKVHCVHAVETYAQEKLVLETLMHYYPTSVRLTKVWMSLKKPKRKKSQYAYTPNKPKKKEEKEHVNKYNPVKVGEELPEIEKWEQEELDWLDDWAERDFKKKSEEGDKHLCPICLTKHETPSEAVLCCNTKGHNQFCPVCGDWCKTPELALNHCESWENFKTANDGLASY